MFSVGATLAPPRLTKKELRRKAEEKRRKDKWATHELSDVWNSLGAINEAWDARAIRGFDDDGEDEDAWPSGVAGVAAPAAAPAAAAAPAEERTFADVRISEADFGASVLPESDLKNAKLWDYRDPSPADASDSEDECPRIEDLAASTDPAPPVPSPILKGRLGEAWTPPRVRIDVDAVKHKAERRSERRSASGSRKSVAELSDLASGETVDVDRLLEGADRPVEYPRNRTPTQDAMDEKAGRQFKKDIDDLRRRHELKKERKLLRKVRAAVGSGAAAVSSSDDDDDDDERDSDDSGDGLDVDAPAGPPPTEAELADLAWDKDRTLEENLEHALKRVSIRAPLGQDAPADVLEDIPNDAPANPSLLAFLDND
ncbi:hypothetical protein SO694_00007418 [Aureococcus anophagefferens]|uniref:Ribosome biogenesis protein NOP53 n=2 Tax=Aureococcus anophagefferens TaxID=44056 RepID=A0ABR1GAS6_AURAN